MPTTVTYAFLNKENSPVVSASGPGKTEEEINHVLMLATRRLHKKMQIGWKPWTMGDFKLVRCDHD